MQTDVATTMFFAGDVFSTSEMAATMAEITKIDPNFNKDKFLRECEREIVPTVLEVSLKFLNRIFVLLCFKPCCIERIGI